MVESYSRDIGMEFVMDKCKVLVMKDGKQVRSDILDQFQYHSDKIIEVT